MLHARIPSRFLLAFLALVSFAFSGATAYAEDSLADKIRKAAEEAANKLKQDAKDIADKGVELANSLVKQAGDLFDKVKDDPRLQFTLGIAYGIKSGVTDDVELAIDVVSFGKGVFEKAAKMRVDDWSKMFRDSLESVRGNIPKLIEASKAQAAEAEKFVVKLAEEMQHVKVELEIEKAWLVATSTGKVLFDALSQGDPIAGLERIISGEWIEDAVDIPPAMQDAIEDAAYFLLLAFQEGMDQWNALSPFEKGVVTGMLIYALAPWNKIKDAGKVVAKTSLQKLKDAARIRAKRGKTVALSFEKVAVALKRHEAIETLVKFCVLLGTTVATADGDVAIQDIRRGDSVLGLVQEQTLPCAVSTTSYCSASSIVRIAYATGAGDPGEVFVTREHRLWEASRGDWIPASEMRAGYELKLIDGSATVESVEIRYAQDGPYTVCNLEVEQAHNFFIGPDRVLAHNGAPNRNCARLSKFFNSALLKRSKNGIDLTPGKAVYTKAEREAVWEAFQESMTKLRKAGQPQVLNAAERKSFYQSVSKNYFGGGLIEPETLQYGKAKNTAGTQLQHWFPGELRRQGEGKYASGAVVRVAQPEAHTAKPNGMDYVIEQRILAIARSENAIPQNVRNYRQQITLAAEHVKATKTLNQRLDLLEQIYKEEYFMKFPRALFGQAGGNW